MFMLVWGWLEVGILHFVPNLSPWGREQIIERRTLNETRIHATPAIHRQLI